MRLRLDDDQAAEVLAAVEQVGDRTTAAVGQARDGLDRAADGLVGTAHSIREMGEVLAIVAVAALLLAVTALALSARTAR